MELLKEKWIGTVYEVSIGQGDKEVKVGGEESLPFSAFEGIIPHRPAVALEIWEQPPTDWPPKLAEVFAAVWADPVAWGKKCQELGADLICLRSRDVLSPEDYARLACEVAEAVDLPLIVMGCGHEERDKVLLVRAAEALAGQRALLGYVTPNNYQDLAAAAQKYGHNLIAATPLDINLAKELNILLTDRGVPKNQIVNDPLVGALGYGIEYGYSIMERTRTSALTGDQMLSMPLFCLVGQEAWKTREALEADGQGGVLWEALTAAAYTWAGADLVVLRHPETLHILREHWDNLLK